MKTPQESTATIITTPNQRQLIKDLSRKHLEEGGSLLAQVFSDGLRIKVLTPAQTSELSQAICKALGVPERKLMSKSAFDFPGDVK